MSKTAYWIAIVVLIIIAGAVAWHYANLEETLPPIPGTGSGAGPEPPPGTVPDADAGPTDAVIAQAASDASASAEQVSVVSVSPREWPDGCLGLAQAGEFCTQALVPGYEVTVSVNGANAVYRTNADGTAVRKAP